MKVYFITFFVLLSTIAFTQKEWVIKGVITDTETKMPVSGCYIHVMGTTHFANTNEAGQFNIIFIPLADSISISCTHSNYEQSFRHDILIKKSDNKKVLEINFEIKFSSYLLPEMTINSKPDSVWGDAALNVADFAFVGKNLLLLTYEKEERWKRQEESKMTLYKGCRLVLLDSNHKEITRTMVSGYALKFYVDYLEQVFLECRDNIFHLNFENNKITLEKMEDKAFNDGIKTVIDTIGTLTYFSNYNENYPAFEYMIYNSKDSAHHTFRHMEDESMMVMLRSEYKYLDTRGKLEAFRFEVNTGIDKEIIAAYMNGFQNSSYYEPLNTPLILNNDTLLLFDHRHDKLVRFDWQGLPIDSVMIKYHRTKRPEKWSSKIYRDKTTEKIYTALTRNSTTIIKEIDAHNGESRSVRTLSYHYAENIRIWNHCVYYIYRPFESSQNKYLYKERLQD